jgi:hypothetical protein
VVQKIDGIDKPALSALGYRVTRFTIDWVPGR